MRVLRSGLSFPESPRWHDGRVWLCDWGAHTLLAVDPSGEAEAIARVQSFPFCIDWLPDGRLLITSAADRAVLTVDGETYADLSTLGSSVPGNEIACHPSGRAYVNGAGFADGVITPGTVAVVEADGRCRTVAQDLQFPNGMAITADGSTLIVAESHAGCLTAFDIAADGGLSGRRVWAAVEGSAPDGICLDPSGAVWYADVPNRCCVRVREGGDVLARVEFDRGCFSCALHDGTLYVAAREWHGMANIAAGEGTGQLLAVDVGG